MGFVFAFRVEQVDNYQMQVDMSYTSKYFTDQLNKFIAAHEDIDPYQLHSSQAQIDFMRRKVTRHQSKKYKFEALRPFEVSKNIAVRDNKYFLQVKVTKLNPNKIFPSSFTFLMANPDLYTVEDLNEGIFDTAAVFNTDEIRSFVYILTPIRGHTINRCHTEKLGQLEIKWVNYMGDPGFLKVGPLKFTAESATQFEIDIVQCRDQKMELDLEEP